MFHPSTMMIFQGQFAGGQLTSERSPVPRNMAARAEEFRRWWQLAAPVVKAGRLDGMKNGIGALDAWRDPWESWGLVEVGWGLRIGGDGWGWLRMLMVTMVEDWWLMVISGGFMGMVEDVEDGWWLMRFRINGWWWLIMIDAWNKSMVDEVDDDFMVVKDWWLMMVIDVWWGLILSNDGWGPVEDEACGHFIDDHWCMYAYWSNCAWVVCTKPSLRPTPPFGHPHLNKWADGVFKMGCFLRWIALSQISNQEMHGNAGLSNAFFIT